jgi:hypothetical protein
MPEHIVNIAVVAIMGCITKIAAVENMTAIWEYDPDLPDNHVLGGSLDVIAAVRTIAIKVCSINIYCQSNFTVPSDSSLWSTNQVLQRAPDSMQDAQLTSNPTPQQYLVGLSIQHARSLIQDVSGKSNSVLLWILIDSVCIAT